VVTATGVWAHSVNGGPEPGIPENMMQFGVRGLAMHSPDSVPFGIVLAYQLPDYEVVRDWIEKRDYSPRDFGLTKDGGASPP
jgi:hypothetical protein